MRFMFCLDVRSLVSCDILAGTRLGSLCPLSVLCWVEDRDMFHALMLVLSEYWPIWRHG
jgi:hypothetical protein